MLARRMESCDRRRSAGTARNAWAALAVVTVSALACAVDNRVLSGPSDGGKGGAAGIGSVGSTGGTGGAVGTTVLGPSDAGGNDAPLLPPLVWVAIPGGSFAMGGDDTYGGDNNMPIHTVDVPSFEITQTEITVAAYDACINAGWCADPLSNEANSTCTWNSVEPQQHPNLPVDCVTWRFAHEFCSWVGGRLPSEAEWEYAARSAGQTTTYPWGAAAPTCDLTANNLAGCSLSIPDPVCSHPAGNTAQGLCDMAGNVWEWVEDAWSSSGYTGAPADGSAQETGAPSGPEGQPRVERGGGFNDGATDVLRNVYRAHFPQEAAGYTLGIRCARSGTP
jgi:formylglycine-generating enzyme required for sulfatase activity